jgi:hypothetical protein
MSGATTRKLRYGAGSPGLCFSCLFLLSSSAPPVACRLSFCVECVGSCIHLPSARLGRHVSLISLVAALVLPFLLSPPRQDSPHLVRFLWWNVDCSLSSLIRLPCASCGFARWDIVLFRSNARAWVQRCWPSSASVQVYLHRSSGECCSH